MNSAVKKAKRVSRVSKHIEILFTDASQGSRRVSFLDGCDTTRLTRWEHSSSKKFSSVSSRRNSNSKQQLHKSTAVQSLFYAHEVCHGDGLNRNNPLCRLTDFRQLLHVHVHAPRASLSIFPRPLTRSFLVSLTIGFVGLSNFRNERVVGVRVRQERAYGKQDLRHSEGRTPLIPKNVKTYAAIRIDVRVINPSSE